MNRLRTHLANGGIVVSANITDFPEDTSDAIWTVYDEWLDKNALSDSVKNRINFLKIHNRNADKALEEEIKNHNFSYSKVYGGYNGTNGVSDSYELSFIIYAKNKNGENADFKILFKFAVKLCNEFYQNSVYVQPPGEKPYYVNDKGKPISRPGKNDIKYNRYEEEFFTTVKRKKNNAQRFTADIEFESFRVKRLSNFEKMRQKQYGEVVLE